MYPSCLLALYVILLLVVIYCACCILCRILVYIIYCYYIYNILLLYYTQLIYAIYYTHAIHYRSSRQSLSTTCLCRPAARSSLICGCSRGTKVCIPQVIYNKPLIYTFDSYMTISYIVYVCIHMILHNHIVHA